MFNLSMKKNEIHTSCRCSYWSLIILMIWNHVGYKKQCCNIDKLNLPAWCRHPPPPPYTHTHTKYGFEVIAFILCIGVIVSYWLIASYISQTSQIFNKSLLAKFAWAMDVDPDFRFWYFELILSWPQHPLSPHLKEQKKKKKKTEVHFVLSFPIKDINIFLVSSGKFDVVCTSNLIMGRVTPFLTFFFFFFFPRLRSCGNIIAWTLKHLISIVQMFRVHENSRKEVNFIGYIILFFLQFVLLV